jgi:hypothetical protein
MNKIMIIFENTVLRSKSQKHKILNERKQQQKTDIKSEFN